MEGSPWVGLGLLTALYVCASLEMRYDSDIRVLSIGSHRQVLIVGKRYIQRKAPAVHLGESVIHRRACPSQFVKI